MEPFGAKLADAFSPATSASVVHKVENGDAQEAPFTSMEMMGLVQQSWSFNGYESNRFFLNQGTGQFIETGDIFGVSSKQDARGVAVGDLDLDGDLDLVVSNRNAPHLTIYRNDQTSGHHYLAITLEGTRSNRMGIGSRLTVHCHGKKQTRYASLGSGYLGQSTLLIWFGLGPCKTPTLDIDWPSGIHQRLEKVPVDQRLRITETQSL